MHQSFRIMPKFIVYFILFLVGIMQLGTLLASSRGHAPLEVSSPSGKQQAATEHDALPTRADARTGPLGSDPVKILETLGSLHQEAHGTTRAPAFANDGRKCQRFQDACCAKLLESLAQDRRVHEESLCTEYQLNGCRCDTHVA